jgi:hypothetical protein
LGNHIKGTATTAAKSDGAIYDVVGIPVFGRPELVRGFWARDSVEDLGCGRGRACRKSCRITAGSGWYSLRVYKHVHKQAEKDDEKEFGVKATNCRLISREHTYPLLSGQTSGLKLKTCLAHFESAAPL